VITALSYSFHILNLRSRTITRFGPVMQWFANHVTKVTGSPVSIFVSGLLPDSKGGYSFQPTRCVECVESLLPSLTSQPTVCTPEPVPMYRTLRSGGPNSILQPSSTLPPHTQILLRVLVVTSPLRLVRLGRLLLRLPQLLQVAMVLLHHCRLLSRKKPPCKSAQKPYLHLFSPHPLPHTCPRPRTKILCHQIPRARCWPCPQFKSTLPQRLDLPSCQCSISLPMEGLVGCVILL
jgi:hypothetical protein